MAKKTPAGLGLFQTRTKAGWTVAVAGLMAAAMGAAGLLGQDTQMRAVGLDPAKYPSDDPLRTTMSSTSVAALSNGFVYMLGAAKSWPWFPAFTVAARSAQAAGFVYRIRTGKASKAYVSAAVWEAAGAAITLGAMWWDGRSGEL
jgi:hypothetical protein